MRTVILATLLAVSTSAYAQPGPLTPAPVPGVDSGHVAPADRAGESNTAANQAPFAGAPNNMVPGAGQATPQTMGTPDSRQTAPAPSINK
jgi:hypothetical protein